MKAEKLHPPGRREVTNPRTGNQHQSTDLLRYVILLQNNFLPCQLSVVLTIYTPQATDRPIPSPVPTAAHRPPTPPKAAVAPSNSPGPLRAVLSGSEYNHGRSEFRDNSESLGPAVPISGTAVTGPSLTPPPQALLLPPNNIGRGNASTSSLAASSSDDGRGLSPRSTGIERRQSSRHAETMARSASRMEGMYTQGFVVPPSH